MISQKAYTTPRHAFTLVELAIVLVIIGLLVGGVLVGQDLIKAATIRSVVTDLERYNAGATTFRTKYNGLPGDLTSTKATDFGFNTTTTDANRDGTAFKGNGNGLLDGCATSINMPPRFGCETGLFWTDLSRAGLIPQPLTGYTSTTAAIAISEVKQFMPKLKLRDTLFVGLINNGVSNYFLLADLDNTAANNTAGTPTVLWCNGWGVTPTMMTPLEARNIDEKIDDGLPLTGNMYAAMCQNNVAYMLRTGVAAPASAGTCMNGTASDAPYNVRTNSIANQPACSVLVRASF